MHLGGSECLQCERVVCSGGRVGVGLGEEAGTEGIGIKSLGEAGGIAVARRLPTCNPLGDPLSQLMEEALVAGAIESCVQN